MIAIPTGKCDQNDNPIYLFAENCCAQIWHREARERTIVDVNKNDEISLCVYLPRSNRTSRSTDGTSLSTNGTQTSVGIEEAVAISRDVDANSGNDIVEVSGLELLAVVAQQPRYDDAPRGSSSAASSE